MSLSIFIVIMTHGILIAVQLFLCAGSISERNNC